jgi:hypothetical protein
LLLVLALVLAGCGGTRLPTRLVPAKQIGPVRLQESRSAVERVLGPGTVVAHYRRFPTTPEVVFVSYPKADLIVRYDRTARGWVSEEVQTSSQRYQTVTGIGVGSTLSRLEADAIACGPQIEGQYLCQLRSEGPGRSSGERGFRPSSTNAKRPVTILYVKGRRVLRVFLLPKSPAKASDPDAAD